MEEKHADHTSEFEWSVKELKSRSKKNVYKRGTKSYGALILTVFVFSFIGAISFLSTSFVRAIDNMLGIGLVNYDHVKRVSEYIVELPVIKDLPDPMKQEVRYLGMDLALNHEDILSILEFNHEYVERNMGEVIGFLIIAMLFLTVGVFLIRKVLIVGQHRFCMERRFKEDVQFRRTIAPFDIRSLKRVVLTMLSFYITLGLWSLTVIGGVYKWFEYFCVPYIVAENPNVTWKEAKKLSAEMTKGYKWKLFLMRLSCLHYYLISLLPVGDLLFTTPVLETLGVEAYFKLRSRRNIDRSLLVEEGFDGKAYLDRLEGGEKPEDIKPVFKLKDFEITGSSFDLNDTYSFFDLTIMFFLFSFVGWLWEVSLHFFNYHVFVNRGFMHGPWLPIYGAGGAAIIFLLSKYKDNKPKLFVMTMLLCGFLEYLTSFALDFFKNAQYWDYKDMFLNLNGRICLAGLIAFAIGGFLGVYIIGPFVKRMLELLGRKKTIILCTVLLAAFAVDIIVCIVKGPNMGEGVGSELAANAAFLMM